MCHRTSNVFVRCAQYDDTGKYEEAAKQFAASLAADPQRPTTLNKMGACLVNLRRFDEGIGYFNRALAIDADNIAAHYNLAAALANTGKLKDAMAHCEAGRSLVARFVGRSRVVGRQTDASSAVLKIDAQFAPAVAMHEQLKAHI